MPNALAHETSPYLLQHRDNPVDWLPWGDEALSRARELDRPLLVSIGYSSCHWCHVMERESFEDPETAALMNERFVCVKVDREERPDVDALYMDAVQAMTGHGGWPLNVFLTPEQAPFYGGTYFPPEPRQGMPSWRQVLGAVADAWDTQREDIRAQGEQVGAAPAAAARCSRRPSEPTGRRALDDAVATLRASFDSVHGGWGGAPKFPPASVIEFLLARDEQPMALQTLRSMAGGGIFDQVGGGFSRYSVDARWTVPHFEKMLYDNALLARAYLHGFQASGDALLRRTAEETLDWALREMRAPEGGFYSALDADSEGVEGKFYVWSVDELRAALGDDADAAIAWFGASERGNFEGANILESRGPEPPPSSASASARRCWTSVRERVRPGLDDKRLARLERAHDRRAGRCRRRPRARATTSTPRAAPPRSCSSRCATPDGRLLRTFNAGTAKLGAYLEDHAFLLEALLVLYEATFEERWFAEARALADTIVTRFGDPERGGFFSTADDHETLDRAAQGPRGHADPGGRVGRRLRTAAARSAHRRARLRGAGGRAARAPARDSSAPPQRVRSPAAGARPLPGPAARGRSGRRPAGVAALAAVVRESRAAPPGARGRAGRRATAVALMEQRTPVDGRAAAYVCERFACRAPVTAPDELRALLEAEL